MSPRVVTRPALQLGFPRVSGDEPALAELIREKYPFSPRERG